MAEEPIKSVTISSENRNSVDINGLVDFSYAGYKYGEDIPNKECDISSDIGECIDIESDELVDIDNQGKCDDEGYTWYSFECILEYTLPPSIEFPIWEYKAGSNAGITIYTGYELDEGILASEWGNGTEYDCIVEEAEGQYLNLLSEDGYCPEMTYIQSQFTFADNLGNTYGPFNSTGFQLLWSSSAKKSYKLLFNNSDEHRAMEDFFENWPTEDNPDAVLTLQVTYNYLFEQVVASWGEYTENPVFVDTEFDTNCPDVSQPLQNLIDANPEQTICLPSGLYRIDNDIIINSNNTILRGHGDGTYLYSKGPSLKAFERMQHFGETCPNYNDLPEMCASIPNCTYDESFYNNCYNHNVFPSIIIRGPSDDLGLPIPIIQDEELGSNTLMLASIGNGDDKLKCGDEIIIEFEMTEDFVDEYSMIEREQDKIWKLGDTHTMFRRTITKPPQLVNIQAPPNIPLVIGGDGGERTQGTKPILKRIYKLTFDVPLKHHIKTTYNTVVRKKLNPYLQNVGLEDLYVSDIIPYTYSQKKYKPYTKENFIVSNNIIAIYRTKNSWIKNVNSFAPTIEYPGLIELLYGVNNNEVRGLPKVEEAPMKSNATNIFCNMTKFPFAFDLDDYWGEKVCDIAYNASIWNELWIRMAYADYDLLQIFGIGEVIFSNPGSPCKTMDDNYGDMYYDQHEQWGEKYGVPTLEEQSYMSGYPPPQFSAFIESVVVDGDVGRAIIKDDSINIVRDWFENNNVPTNEDLSHYAWQIRFHNPTNPDDIGEWHNCGHFPSDNGDWSCWTFAFTNISSDYSEIEFSGVEPYDLYGGPEHGDYYDNLLDFVPEDLNPAPDGMSVQLSIGGTTDCSGVCQPKELINVNGEFKSVQFCDPYNSDIFDASCCICQRLDDTEHFPVNYCDPPLWLGTNNDNNLIDSRPEWMNKFYQTNFSNYIAEPDTDYSVINTFNEFFKVKLDNPTNVQRYDHHILTGGMVLSSNRNITIKDCTLKLPQNRAGGGNGYLFNISIGNNDILIEDCEGYRGRHNFLSGGVFSNSGIVHNRVKSSGGWLWLNETGTDGNSESWYEYTDDEWWSRWQGLEIIGLGKPGFSDNHTGLTFGSLYTDSEISDGLAWHNRRDLSGGSGITTTNSVIWNLRGHDETSDKKWENASVPGMSMIQSFGAAPTELHNEGIIYHDSSYDEALKPYYMYLVSIDEDPSGTDEDEEVANYMDYINNLIIPFDVNLEQGFNQNFGIFSALAPEIINTVLRNGVNISTKNIIPDLMDPVTFGPFVVPRVIFSAKISPETSVDFDYNELTGIFEFGFDGKVDISFEFDVDGLWTFVGTAVSNSALNCTINLNIGQFINLTTSGFEDVQDVELNGWFPGESLVEDFIHNFLSNQISQKLEEYGGNSRLHDIIMENFINFTPAKLKYYSLGEDETVFDELQNDDITEASGLVHSRQYDDVFWTHNDLNESLDPNTIYAFNSNGVDLGEFKLTGLPLNLDGETINQRDWEDMAYDGTYLYIGEIGDNNTQYGTYYVYKFLEPDVNNPPTDNKISCTSIAFQYDDGESYDAETLMVDTNGDIYIVTKSSGASKLFILEGDVNTTMATAVYLTDISFPASAIGFFNQITSGDISPDGTSILIHTYEKIYKFERGDTQTIQDAVGGEYEEVAYERKLFEQGEAVTWAADGLGYYTISEEIYPVSKIATLLKDFVGSASNFPYGDARLHTGPSDKYYEYESDLIEEETIDYPIYPSLYDIQREIRLDNLIDTTLFMCTRKLVPSVDDENERTNNSNQYCDCVYDNNCNPGYNCVIGYNNCIKSEGISGVCINEYTEFKRIKG